jgi:hypothetical protein
MYGPAGPYLNAYLFRFFGIHLSVLYWAGAFSCLVSALVLYLAGMYLSSWLVGWTAEAVLLLGPFGSSLFCFPLPYSFTYRSREIGSSWAQLPIAVPAYEFDSSECLLWRPAGSRLLTCCHSTNAVPVDGDGAWRRMQRQARVPVCYSSLLRGVHKPHTGIVTRVEPRL